MTARNETRPFTVTLAVSLLLHAAFALVIPGFPARKPLPKIDTVVVELEELPVAAPPEEPRVSPQLPLPKGRQPETREEVPAPLPAPEPEHPRPEAPQAEATPPRPSQPSAVAAPAQTSPAQASPAPPAAKAQTAGLAGRDAPTQASVVARKTEAARAARGPLDLTPQPRDLAAHRNGGSSGETPQAAPAEATVNLRDPSGPFAPYATQVKGAVEAAWSNWREALLAARQSGIVVVRFTLGPDGTIDNVAFEKRSGSPILDGEAESAIRRAKLPPFPPHWTITRLHLIAQFDYILR